MMLRCASTTPASRFRPRTMASTSGLVVMLCACDQSTARPSQTSDARPINQRSSGLSVNPHLLGQPNERAAHRHARRPDRCLAEELGDLVVLEPQFHLRDDQLAIDRAKPLQRALVASQRVAADGQFQRRRIVGDLLVGQLARNGTPVRPPDDIAQPVAQRLTGVGPERVLVRRREPVELGDRSDAAFPGRYLRCLRGRAPRTGRRPRAQRRRRGR